MAYVYRHIRLDKNIPFYIGIGIDDNGEYRRAYDFHNGRRSIVWRRVFNKTAIEVDILLDELTPDQAKQKEMEFIALYGRKDLGKGALVNKTDGGDFIAGLVFTEEHKRKLSEIAKRRVVSDEQKQKLREYRLGKSSWNKGIAKENNPLYGRKVSDEIKLKGSLAKRGNKNPMFGISGENHHGFKGFIYAYKDGIEIGKYSGVHDAAKRLGVQATKISACVLGERNKHGGYTFKRK